MLRFILGKSGSGKTAEALRILAESAKNGSKKLLMLVPDQYSFETETAFLDLLGPKLCGNVLVFGFGRLCDYVFDITGNNPQNVLDDGVRKILMSRALDECRDSLEFFASKKSGKSVLELMLHSLKEWKKNSITSEMIKNVSDSIENETLRKKLCETALALDVYDALLSETYIDPLDNLTRLSGILRESDLFDGYTVAVDSFSGFTRQQLEVLSALMERSENFFVTVNIDSDDRNCDVFSTTNRTLNQIKRLAQKNGAKLAQDIILKGRVRSDKAEFSFLEKYFLRPCNSVFNEKTEAVETFIASDIYREVEYVAKKIQKLVTQDNYCYGDIAVITRAVENYGGIIQSVFEKFAIPYFLSVPRDILTKPVARFISSAFDFLLFGLDRESLLSMLKTGLTQLSETEIADFENYLYTWDVNRSALKKEFKDNPSGFSKLTDYDEQLLNSIENTRRTVMEPLLAFKESCKDAEASGITRALYKLLCDFEVEKSVIRLYDALESQGLVFEAQEEVRVYNLVIEALDRLNAAAGEMRVDLKKYREYLGYMFSDIAFGDIPRYQDQVNIGAADRVRLNDEKAVFVIGAVDGIFPSIPKTAGAFSEIERRLLIEKDIPLTDSLEQLASHEKYLAYCALTSPSEKLFVTAYTADFSGNSYLPSDILTDIARLFPNRIHSRQNDVNEAFELYNDRQAFEYLAENFRAQTPEIKSLKRYFYGKSAYRPLVVKLEQIVEHKPFRINNPENAEKLFGKNITISASQLEKYNLCAFQYFCNYGLRAKERPKASIDAIQFGNVVHYCMEKFLKSHNKSVLNALSESDISESVDGIMKEYADENLGGLEGKEADFLNLFSRLKENVVILINYIINQLAHSDFVPVDYELRIGEGGAVPACSVALDGGGYVRVQGYVDRVDLCPKNGDEYYFRIIDYKTGPKTFTLSEILCGINMQMLIYLKSIADNGSEYYNKKLVPSGILYMPSSAPVVADDKDRDKNIRDKFKMNGLVLKDSDVLEKMDSTGDFIKLSKKNIDGEFSETLADFAQFRLIFERIDYTIKKMGESLHAGRVEASPLKGIENGCEYCPYGSVCLHKYGDSIRYFEKVSAKDVYSVLSKGGADSE